MVIARARKKGRANASPVRVRMYRVGFGDCFLVTLRGRKTRHILVDCGVHNRGDIGRLEAVVDNIARETRGRLDLVIATHAHEDHISGFARFGEQFRGMDVGEVWMPWCEDPSDKVAVRMKRKTARLVAGLAQHFAAAPPSAAALDALTNLAAASNTQALDNLRHAFGSEAKVRYFEAGSTLSAAAGIDGLTARFLGPPKDEAFLKKMDPPADQRFLAMNAAGKVVLLDDFHPFQDVDPADAWAPRLPRKDEQVLKEWSDSAAAGLAFALTEVLNNTSLVILFSYRGKQLLFPGDAQYGNWKSWLEAEDGPDILSKVHFYKVAHHGSHNATPRAAIEGMSHKDLAAMVSTQNAPWPSIPQGELIDALTAQTGGRLMRSDWIAVPGASSEQGPSRMPSGFRKGAFWVDWEAR